MEAPRLDESGELVEAPDFSPGSENSDFHKSWALAPVPILTVDVSILDDAVFNHAKEGNSWSKQKKN